MVLVADSGSTKTIWRTVDNDSLTVVTQGINPVLLSKEEMANILRTELTPKLNKDERIDAVWFYGAGCTSEKSMEVASILEQVLRTKATHVASDMLGAARGLCKREQGIVCILGTGSNSCFYDGQDIQAGVPSLGYILGDEGSGAYIGKRLVNDIFKRLMPKELVEAFHYETGETLGVIIQKVYRGTLPNRFLASLSPFCAKHKEHPAIQALLLDCFDQFATRNLIPLRTTIEQTQKMLPTHFVGSIAFYYRDLLKTALERHGFTLGNVVQSPIDGLVAFHRNA